MAQIQISGTGNALMQIMNAEDLEPGAQPSYQTCKTIYSYHPLGLKMADSPIKMAQSKMRRISVPAGPEERVREAFEVQWKALGANKVIRNCARLARVYGISTVAVLTDGKSKRSPLDLAELAASTIHFNVLDPLNTAGSLVLNQDPNAPDFQKVKSVAVAGQPYHPSRTVVLMHEEPIYIEYTTSAFGFTGRSVYQRALYPLKTYIQTLRTDDLVVIKSGVLIAKIKSVTSAIGNMVLKAMGLKRSFVKEAATGSVINIEPEEEIETLNMQNLDGAYSLARKNVLENIALAADMPAKLLNAESFAEGFGEGTEDAKHVAEYVEGIREWMQPLYDFMDAIVQRKAWTPEFFKTIQAEFPEAWGEVDYNTAFYSWKNSFRAEWPSLLEEPDSEKVKVDDVKLKAVIAMVQVVAPMVDPENKVQVLQWACDNFNALKMMFTDPLVLDWDELLSYLQEQKDQADEAAAQASAEPAAAPPFSARDASLPGRPDLSSLSDAVTAMSERRDGRVRNRALERIAG